MKKTFTYYTRKTGIQRIPLSTIVYMENNLRKVIIYTLQDTRSYYGKLTDAMEQLDDRFAMVHRSYVINLERVTALHEGRVVLNDGLEIMLGNHSIVRLRKMLKNQINT